MWSLDCVRQSYANVGGKYRVAGMNEVNEGAHRYNNEWVRLCEWEGESWPVKKKKIQRLNHFVSAREAWPRGWGRAGLAPAQSESIRGSIRGARSSQLHSKLGKLYIPCRSSSSLIKPFSKKRRHGQTEDIFGQTVPVLPDPEPAASPGPGRVSRHSHPCGKCVSVQVCARVEHRSPSHALVSRAEIGPFNFFKALQLQMKSLQWSES